MKRKDAEPPAGEPTVLELLERGETTRFLHPGLDVVDGVLSYGIPVGDRLTIVTSRREGFTPQTLPSGMALRHADPGPSSVRHETAAAWLAGSTEGSVARALDGLADFLGRHVALRDAGTAGWLAAWTFGTWCYRAFRVYPYLSVRSAERRCGKSRLMRLLCRAAFNASPPTTHPTEAQLYREAARRSGLQAFDEMESLRGGGDKDRLATLIAVLNVGFEQGGAVSRQEKRGEPVPDSDALDHAQSLGDDVKQVDETGCVARWTVHPDGAGAVPAVQWHALGTVHAEPTACPVCRAVCEVDDDSPELPACPACATRDTWEARQGGRYRGIVGAIDGCPSLEALAALGKRLYALALTRDQAGVACSHYHLRKQALEAPIALGRPARGLLATVEHASPRALGRVGARLYHVQHTDTRTVTTQEWRRIWQAYHARRATSV